MRETRITQASLFDNYSKHELGLRLKALSDLLDDHPEVLTILEGDLIDPSVKKVGRNGLSVESIFRCLLLKQQLRISYEQLSFHLSDSISYRTFTRLPDHVSPSRSGLQSTIRNIKPQTLEAIFNILSTKWIQEGGAKSTPKTQRWMDDVKHYQAILKKVIDQTQRRVINKEKVPASEKIVSIFEDHTDIIIKGARDIQYGHKVNLSTEAKGFITHFSIESGNPSDKDLFLPVLYAHEKNYGCLPASVVCDGGYASKANVENGRSRGLKHAVFHKRIGISYQDMGVKLKTFKKLRNFRAGVEGNISELKRSFDAGKAKWKGHEGFKAFVWSSVISYNLIRMARQKPV